MSNFFNEVFNYRGEEITQEQIQEAQRNPVVERRINLDEQKMVLKLETKSVYGRYLYYPMCEKSKTLINIFQDDQKTFTEEQVKVLHQVGFRILLTFPNIKGEINYSPND